MIFGHLGVAGAAQSLSRARLGTVGFLAFLLAAVTPDVVDAVYFVVGFCSPFGLYSHTVPAALLQTAVVAGIAYLATESAATTATFAAIVLLHVPADFPTGHKLFMPGGEIFGLDFYRRPPLDLLLEVPVIFVGWWLLRRTGRGPSWARTRWAVGLVMLAQTFLDVYGFGLGARKPSGCATPVSPSERIVLVDVR